MQAGLVVAEADDLIPDKRQFRKRFPQSAQLLLSGNDFSGRRPPCASDCRVRNFETVGEGLELCRAVALELHDRLADLIDDRSESCAAVSR